MADPQIVYIMLALPALFGVTLIGEGIMKLSHYESGWFNIVLGVVFLGVAVFGYFYIRSVV